MVSENAMDCTVFEPVAPRNSEKYEFEKWGVLIWVLSSLTRRLRSRLQMLTTAMAWTTGYGFFPKWKFPRLLTGATKLPRCQGAGRRGSRGSGGGPTRPAASHAPRAAPCAKAAHLSPHKMLNLKLWFCGIGYMLETRIRKQKIDWGWNYENVDDVLRILTGANRFDGCCFTVNSFQAKKNSEKMRARKKIL